MIVKTKEEADVMKERAEKAKWPRRRQRRDAFVEQTDETVRDRERERD